MDRLKIDARVRALLAEQLKKQPKVSVKKAVKTILADETSAKAEPVRYQLELIAKKADSRHPSDRADLADYLKGTLALPVVDEENQELLLYSEAYDEVTFSEADDFVFLNDDLRNYFIEVRDTHRDISNRKLVDIASKLGKPGASELTYLSDEELASVFADSSI